MQELPKFQWTQWNSRRRNSASSPAACWKIQSFTSPLFEQNEQFNEGTTQCTARNLSQQASADCSQKDTSFNSHPTLQGHTDTSAGTVPSIAKLANHQPTKCQVQGGQAKSVTALSASRFFDNCKNGTFPFASSILAIWQAPRRLRKQRPHLLPPKSDVERQARQVHPWSS